MTPYFQFISLQSLHFLLNVPKFLNLTQWRPQSSQFYYCNIVCTTIFKACLFVNFFRRPKYYKTMQQVILGDILKDILEFYLFICPGRNMSRFVCIYAIKSFCSILHVARFDESLFIWSKYSKWGQRKVHLTRKVY